MRISDWSSDVCASDLIDRLAVGEIGRDRDVEQPALPAWIDLGIAAHRHHRSIGMAQLHHPRFLGDEQTAVGEEGHPERLFQLADLLNRERSEEHTSELQSLMRSSYAVVCLKKNTNNQKQLEPHHI